jgi:hypothetical protein
LNISRNPNRFDTPVRYRVRIEGPLDQRWSAYLCDMAISSVRRRRGPTVTTLTGELVDQAALMGVLNTVYDLGLTLIRVERLSGSEGDSKNKSTPEAPDEC